MELKPTCIDTGMSQEERVARREDEIEKALCVLYAYAEYGPEGAGDACQVEAKVVRLIRNKHPQLQLLNIVLLVCFYLLISVCTIGCCV